MSCHDPQFPKPDCENMKTKNECLSVTWTDPNEGPAKCTWDGNVCINEYSTPQELAPVGTVITVHLMAASG